MTALVRRTWANLRDEHILRVAREGDANYTSRAERFVESAYYDLCSFFHHPALEASSSETLVSGVSVAAVPSDLFILTEASLALSGVSTSLELVDHQVLRKQRLGSSGTPTRVSRNGSFLWFDRNVDNTYNVILFFVKHPDAPDFAAGGPVIDQAWDEHILDLSVAMAEVALYGGEMAERSMSLLNRFAEMHPSAKLIDGGSGSAQYTSKAGRTAGGEQK